MFQPKVIPFFARSGYCFDVRCTTIIVNETREQGHISGRSTALCPGRRGTYLWLEMHPRSWLILGLDSAIMAWQ